MVANDEDWRSQFIGKSGTLAVTKDGGDIDAITGATITSRAVTAGVNAAVKIVEEVAAK
jgi:electron transport complex protein RnfG